MLKLICLRVVSFPQRRAYKKEKTFWESFHPSNVYSTNISLDKLYYKLVCYMTPGHEIIHKGINAVHLWKIKINVNRMGILWKALINAIENWKYLFVFRSTNLAIIGWRQSTTLFGNPK